jgi:hypothetical protein
VRGRARDTDERRVDLDTVSVDRRHGVSRRLPHAVVSVRQRGTHGGAGGVAFDARQRPDGIAALGHAGRCGG